MADTKNYVLGRGKVYFDPHAEGTTTGTGERYLGNTTEFNLSIESETLDHFDSDEGVRSKDKSVILELNRSGSLTTDNISEENVALFVLGEVQTVIQAGTAVTGEALGAVIPDRYYQLGQDAANPQGVRDVTAVTVTFGATTAVLGTDYELDTTLARVHFLEGGLADGATAATVSYTPTANTRQRVVTSGAATIQGSLRYVAYNAAGRQKDVYAPLVSLQPTGDLALKGDDWQNMSFSVEIGQLPGMAALYIDGRPTVV